MKRVVSKGGVGGEEGQGRCDKKYCRKIEREGLQEGSERCYESSERKTYTKT